MDEVLLDIILFIYFKYTSFKGIWIFFKLPKFDGEISWDRLYLHNPYERPKKTFYGLE